MTSATPRILIVDDEVDTCANLSDIFTDLGYEVATAYDGLAALQLAQQKHFDIALLDLRMPGMDGLELYRRLKELSAGTVAMVVTAYATSDTAKSVLSAGAWRLLPKPVNIPHLLGMVQEALESPLVLLVDDDHDLCENLWEIFREQGFRTHLAHDVGEAGEVLRQHAFQVVLLDMKLPGGTGEEVLRVIRQTNQQARTVVITGFPNEMESRVQQALAEGADAVAYKPFDVGKLLTTIRDLAQASNCDAAPDA
jgi:CheY-like chemotaxis protein